VIFIKYFIKVLILEYDNLLGKKENKDNEMIKEEEGFRSDA
jgi:hypothetical protein